jgi:hypothetical protein
MNITFIHRNNVTLFSNSCFLRFGFLLVLTTLFASFSPSHKRCFVSTNKFPSGFIHNKNTPDNQYCYSASNTISLSQAETNKGLPDTQSIFHRSLFIQEFIPHPCILVFLKKYLWYRIYYKNLFLFFISINAP